MRGNESQQTDYPADGFAPALLREIAHMLDRLARDGTSGAIDLRSMPLSDADRSELEEILGQGEIRATLSIAGTSGIRETQFAGVWWICHRGADERIASESIEVTLMPEILKTQIEDIPGGLARLREDIENRQTEKSRREANDN